MAIVRALAIVMLLVVATEACNFSSSCTDITFKGTVMYANCRTLAGKIIRASIDVNQCVGSNKYGELDCSSNFLQKCVNPEFNGITLRATCKKADGSSVVSNRALDNCIQNIEGHLSCC